MRASPGRPVQSEFGPEVLLGDAARLLASSRCGTDIFDVLQRLDGPVVEARGDHHRPVGHTRVVTASGRVNFGSVCRDCELRARCTTAVKGKVLVLGAHDLLLRRQRWFATLDWFQQTYRRYRPMVERSLAWITRGARRLRYRGVARNNAWLHTRVAGVNLRRLIALGLTRTDGAWAITA